MASTERERERERERELALNLHRLMAEIMAEKGTDMMQMLAKRLQVDNTSATLNCGE